MYKKLISTSVVVFLSSTFLINAHATSINQVGPELTDKFSIVDEYGNFKQISFDDIDTDDSKSKAIPAMTDSKFARMNFLLDDEALINDEVKEVQYGVVYLNARSSTGGAYLTYKNVSNPGYDGYTTGAYAKDAAYLGIVNGKVRAMQAGTIMDFPAADVSIIEYDKANISHYYTKDGYTYHKFYYGSKGSANTYRVGYKLPYMKEGTKYYSYDGHYFYTDYKKMIDDYKSNKRTSSVNKDAPYYNYFQYLSHRSLSTITAEQLNKITTDYVGDSASKMKDLGAEYIAHQNTYGVNSLLMYGVSANESAYGTSKIARDKNNLFGHGAVDSNPYYGANGYAKPADSIKYHAEMFMSRGYFDYQDWRYNGAHLGDKSSGVNLRYASDPYWGEKNASVYYYNDTGINDLNKYQIGIIEGVVSNFNFYKRPDTKSQVLYTIGKGKSPKTYNHPVLVLEVIKDSSGKDIWYKVQSDTALNNEGTAPSYKNLYNFERDVAYIPANNVKLLNAANIPSYKRGDVNKNNKIDAADYLMIMDTILSKYKMDNIQKLAGDVNLNGKIDAADYLMIMDHILGKIKL